MAYITNGTITAGGAAQDMIADKHHYMAIVVVNTSANEMFVNVGANAGDEVGERIAPGGSSTFNGLGSKRVSIYGTTTADTFSFREAIG